jgi:hypothetical protein
MYTVPSVTIGDDATGLPVWKRHRSVPSGAESAYTLPS